MVLFVRNDVLTDLFIYQILDPSMIVRSPRNPLRQGLANFLILRRHISDNDYRIVVLPDCCVWIFLKNTMSSV